MDWARRLVFEVRPALVQVDATQSCLQIWVMQHLHHHWPDVVKLMRVGIAKMFRLILRSWTFWKPGMQLGNILSMLW